MGLVGLLDGVAVGNLVGAEEVGERVVSVNGAEEGSTDGLEVGMVVGLLDGSRLGLLVVGALVGITVGSADISKVVIAAGFEVVESWPETSSLVTVSTISMRR